MTTVTRHRFRRHVTAWVRSKPAGWTGGCTCGWRGEPVSIRPLAYAAWRAHRDAVTATRLTPTTTEGHR